jgi:hypothetical protein
MNRNSNRADFGKVRPIEMKSAAADNSAMFFRHDEISNVFAQQEYSAEARHLRERSVG